MGFHTTTRVICLKFLYLVHTERDRGMKELILRTKVDSHEIKTRIWVQTWTINSNYYLTSCVL